MDQIHPSTWADWRTGIDVGLHFLRRDFPAPGSRQQPGHVLFGQGGRIELRSVISLWGISQILTFITCCYYFNYVD